VLITPWLMNLVMLPGEGDDWSGLELGKKQPHRFPSNTYKFMVNEIDAIGKCQTHSLFSPMNEFVNQDHALAVAQSFLDALMVESKPTEEDLVDEKLLGRIVRGEETPEVNLDDFAVTVTEAVETAAVPVRGQPGMKVRVEKKLSRRDLLRGSFLSGV
jgi:[NiFe] hydrogenase assembly HybE family chaperone